MSDSLREGPAPDGPFDVAVVGAGAVGCAVARELTRRGARCVLLEAGPDVGAGTSKANTAILHTGFDAKPGTAEARLVARGYELLSAYASQVGVPTARLGALMVAWTPEQREALAGIRAAAAENGYEETRPVELEELYAREPNLGVRRRGGDRDPRRGHRLPLHDDPRLRHRGTPRRLRPGAERRSAGRPAEWRRARDQHGQRPRPGRVSGQRGRPAQR